MLNVKNIFHALSGEISYKRIFGYYPLVSRQCAESSVTGFAATLRSEFSAKAGVNDAVVSKADLDEKPDKGAYAYAEQVNLKSGKKAH